MQPDMHPKPCEGARECTVCIATPHINSVPPGGPKISPLNEPHLQNAPHYAHGAIRFTCMHRWGRRGVGTWAAVVILSCRVRRILGLLVGGHGGGVQRNVAPNSLSDRGGGTHGPAGLRTIGHHDKTKRGTRPVMLGRRRRRNMLAQVTQCLQA